MQKRFTITAVLAGLLLGLWALPALAQAGDEPTPACPAPEARQFDFWIGEWDVQNWHRNPQAPDDATWYDTGKATNRVYAILDGCAIVEHWMGRLSYATVHGFSVRAYDPEQKQWVLVLYWPGPTGGTFGTLEGIFQHGRGEFFNDFANAQGQRIENRYSFSDISPDAFRWDAATSTDGRLTWKPGWIMEFKKRDPLLDPPLFNGPTRSNDWCLGSAARTFDPFAGEWSGTEGEAAVTVKAYPILNGCAMMDFTVIDAAPRPYKRFRVRAYDANRKVWVQYAIDNRNPVFERTEGVFIEGAVSLLTPTQGEAPLTRESWLPSSREAVLWKRETSSDGGQTWTTTSEIELTKAKL